MANAEERDRLIAAARKATENAHAPYSNFFVGAALLTDDGRTFSGCNVENASYGLTICAERNAVFAAVAATPKGKKLQIVALAAFNARSPACSPCGACRQVISEFAEPSTAI